MPSFNYTIARLEEAMSKLIGEEPGMFYHSPFRRTIHIGYSLGLTLCGKELWWQVRSSPKNPDRLCSECSLRLIKIKLGVKEDAGN